MTTTIPLTRSRFQLPLLLVLAGWAFLSPSRAWAQFDQYTAPGASTDRPADRKEQIEKALEDARWRLGPVRVDPWLSLSNFEYVDNAFGGIGDGMDGTGEDVADLTATVGAGLTAYLPAGPDVVIAAHVLPEYVWWKDLEERRRLNGRYGLTTLGFWNHLIAEATAGRTQQRSFASPELPQPITVRTDRVAVSALLQVTSRISLFGSAEDLALRIPLSDEERADPRTTPFDLLDRDERVLRAGLRYHLPRRWSVGGGVEWTDVEFVPGPATAPVPGLETADRSNSGTSPFVQVQHDTKNSHLSLELSRRKLDPEPGSAFVPYEENAATFLAGFNTTKRFSYALYGRRGLVYALAGGYSYLQDDRLGASVQLALGWRTGMRLYAEGGREDFVRATPAVPERQDDLRAYGLNMTFQANRRAVLALRLTTTDIQSNLPVGNRKFATFGIGLNVGTTRPVP